MSNDTLTIRLQKGTYSRDFLWRVVVRPDKLENSAKWPAWEHWNVFQFNWCLYTSEISDCKYHSQINTQLYSASFIWPIQGRSVVCFDVEAQFNISSPNIFHGHFRIGSFHIFNILKLRPGPLCPRLATPLLFDSNVIRIRIRIYYETPYDWFVYCKFRDSKRCCQLQFEFTDGFEIMHKA